MPSSNLKAAATVARSIATPSEVPDEIMDEEIMGGEIIDAEIMDTEIRPSSLPLNGLMAVAFDRSILVSQRFLHRARMRPDP
ncbi:MAG: hypothetical protein WBN78_05325 [Gammaproteobacteria bacterium]